MNETVFDKEMKDMLHRCADELHAPDKLKTRVDFALKNGSSRPRRRWGRRLIALAAVAAITVTGAFAAGAFGSITSHSWSDQRLSMEQTQQHMEDAEILHALPALFQNVALRVADFDLIGDVILGGVPGLHDVRRHREDGRKRPYPPSVIAIAEAADILLRRRKVPPHAQAKVGLSM